MALGWWGFPLTIFWLIAVPNIINLIDGFDGLAGGLGMFMAVTLGVVGPSLLLLGVLLTLLLGLGALDKTIWPPFAFAGDLLGLALLPLAALRALKRDQAGDSDPG